MSVIPMMIFASLMLAVGSLLLFGYSLNNRDHQHSERLALMPLLEESPKPKPAQPQESQPTSPVAEGSAAPHAAKNHG